jgi:demethylmenaquinone methyltransferase/2-methoxy-6-polyprenyl-1,4-benzoquinol methylase
MRTALWKVFCDISGDYDLVNHVLTGGLDIFWRRKAAKTAAAGGGRTWLDMCSGTGKMAIDLKHLAGDEAMIVAADFCLPMMGNAIRKPRARQIRFVAAEAGAMPFRDGTFDLITISFAARNLSSSSPILIRRLREFHRILRPGGRFVNLETSQPPSVLLRGLFHLLVRIAVPPIGYLLSRSPAGYAYLSRSISRFHSADALAEIIRRAGFSRVDYHRMAFGAVAIHVARK